MKQLTFGFVLFVIGILSLVIVGTINGRTTRASESKEALTAAVEDAVENALDNNTYTINSNKEFVADVLENLMVKYGNNADLEIKINKADHKTGILSLTVVEHYKNPNGHEGSYECTKTIVMEKTPVADYITINYLNSDGSIFQSYKIKNGEKIPVPKTPTETGKTFAGWKKDGKTMSTEQINEDKVSADCSFQATYN